MNDYEKATVDLKDKSETRIWEAKRFEIIMQILEAYYEGEITKGMACVLLNEWGDAKLVRELKHSPQRWEAVQEREIKQNVRSVDLAAELEQEHKDRKRRHAKMMAGMVVDDGNLKPAKFAQSWEDVLKGLGVPRE